MSSTTRTTSNRTRRLVPAAALALALGAGLVACGDEEPADASSSSTAAEASAKITVGDPWVRATTGAEDTTMSAAFMTIDNAGDADVTLTGASTDVAGTVEIHEMSMVDGAMAMSVMDDGLVIEAGRGKVLEPSGYHVMLMDVQRELAAGDEVDLTLEFSDGTTETLTVPVKEFTEEEGHYHEPGTGEHDHGDDEHSDDEHSEDEEHSHS
ncbi:MAG: copper chaperone PCu(A)C [Nocardioides marinisabuli]|uniref:copper chaperone PCu(A)C n=1 Tax=Nocardioides marinisabuli TaxID=419476 RepID=UPI00321B6AD5